MAEPVTADDAFYAICRAMTVVGAGWGVRAKIHALRDRMGISEERHVAITRELQDDARVQNLKEGHHPAAPRAKPAPPPPAPTPPAAAPLPPLPHTSSHKAKARGQPEYGVAGRRDRISSHDPNSLVGHQVTVIQEDDSTVLVTVTAYDPHERNHHVVMNYGTHEQTPAQELPLWDNPQSYQIVGEDPAWEFAPAAPVRTSTGGGGGGGHRHLAKTSSVKRQGTSSVKTGGSKSGGGGGVPSIGGKQPPYEEDWLEGRLEAAPLTELGLMLVAIAKKEAQIHGQLNQGGCGDAEVGASIQKRLEASQQLSQAAKQAAAA